jgi:hypothetical protein
MREVIKTKINVKRTLFMHTEENEKICNTGDERKTLTSWQIKR